MRQADYSGQFKRDVKQAQKRGKEMDKLKTLMTLLLEDEPLSATFHDHPLKGNGVDIEMRISNRIGY